MPLKPVEQATDMALQESIVSIIYVDRKDGEEIELFRHRFFICYTWEPMKMVLDTYHRGLLSSVIYFQYH